MGFQYERKQRFYYQTVRGTAMKNIFLLLLMLPIAFNSYGQSVEEHIERARSKVVLEDFNGAIAELTKAIELHQEDARLYAFRGRVKTRVEDYNGAITDFSKAIELNPEEARIYSLRGRAKLLSGQRNSGCLDMFKARELGDERANEIIRRRCR